MVSISAIWMTFGWDTRDDSSDCKNNSDETPVLERLPAVDPAEQNDRACLEMANNGAADRSCFVDNHELGEVDHACQRTALALISMNRPAKLINDSLEV